MDKEVLFVFSLITWFFMCVLLIVYFNFKEETLVLICMIILAVISASLNLINLIIEYRKK